MRHKLVFEARPEQGSPIAFLDRDGVINADYAYVHRKADFDFLPGAIEAVGLLRKAGFLPVVVTNQSGIGRGKYSEKDFARLTFWMAGVFAAQQAELAAVYYCPHHPEKAFHPYLKACDCRKPAPGMLLEAAQDLNGDLAGSVLFGDKTSDIQAAKAAHVAQAFLVGPSYSLLEAVKGFLQDEH